MAEVGSILTVEGVAELLELSKDKVRELLRSGELRGYKRASKWFILERDVAAYIMEGEGNAQ